MSKPKKSANESRQNKTLDGSVNADSAEMAKKAAEDAQSKLEARAQAIGLEKDATLDEIIAAETAKAKKDAETETARQKALKDENHKLWTLQNTVNTMFAQRAQTNLPGLTETEIRRTLGKTGASVKIEFKYSNEDKTKGYIEMSEFDGMVRCPLQGEFDFGIDYEAITKAMQNANAEQSAK